MIRRLPKISTLLFACFLVLVVGAFLVFWFPNTSRSVNGTVILVPKGASFAAVADSLSNAGVIRSRFTFKLAGRILGYTKSMKAGKYLFVSGQSNKEILYDINTGKSRLIVSVTIPEGWRLTQIAHRYKHDLGIDTQRFLFLCKDTAFLRLHEIHAKSLEGYLLPDTYQFYWGTDENDIIERMLDSFKQFYNDTLKQQQQELHATQKEILTLASIVEAESGLDGERPMIAGVYWNRLHKPMRLEADPTIQYALGEQKRLDNKDLTINSPYNTYRHDGLPPGPINNPGRKAILAVLYPEHHNYLYFVARGTGGHYFAKTFSEHQKNIRLYHKARRAMQQAMKENS
ncbi:MAG TPA: endolytic transglycosylase MltG [Bacteroidota bacterium]|nr:endolytic transglycosylase MltG [Bacteroidota bacterium]